jgi:hypothetical protein
MQVHGGIGEHQVLSKQQKVAVLSGFEAGLAAKVGRFDCCCFVYG